MIRKNHVAVLADDGFRVSPDLPLSHEKQPVWQLRSREEIAARLFALDALITWVLMTEENAPSERIRDYVVRNHLRDYMTEQERCIMDFQRESAAHWHTSTIGWRLENMWALAWVLGFEVKPQVNIGQLPDPITQAMIFEFLPGLNASIQDLLEQHKSRSFEEVAELEDLFYCAHNAVRSAQNGGDTVPEHYDPIADGGTIHERRHSLTWCLSPGVSWEETNLST
ncbi:DUF4272 domain-containing protein [Photobacterium sp. GJ3]|uniref:DUF4272 domain-containing protein n=1 Tax=Photobacterium sp. GJ3 TaxID=2829502 RepID=UPI001B8D05F7|nr:DUF4272 domain-containing protein [Photobacterium sp. GJ3]QUJ66655.1 DUF4272 domain-containing protein [Photobacterium sp. GJ3]